MESGHIIAMLLIGLIAGVLGGALGIGGGLVMIPAMLLVLGETTYGANSIHLYKLAALATAVVLSIQAVRQHVRAGAVVPAMIRGIVPLGLVGVLGGALLARLFTDDAAVTLRRLFGGFMILTVAVNLWRMRAAGAAESSCDRCPIASRWATIGLWVGLPSGMIAGLLGVGGGVWAVPVQNQILGVRIQNAIANSACMIIALAAGGTALITLTLLPLENVNIQDGWLLALLLAPGAAVGGRLGAQLTHRLPITALKYAFYALLAVTGLRLLLG